MRAPKATIALACLVLTLGAQAQDGKASKEREALRRAQTALRAAQEQQSTLQADKAKAEAAAQAALKDATAAQAQAAGLGKRLKAQEGQITALQAQVAELQQALSGAQGALATAQTNERELQRQLAMANETAAARLRSAQSVATLLERSTQALAEAEAKNQKLHDIAQQAIKLYASRSRMDAALLGEPFTGIAGVRLEDQAERLRMEAAPQAVAPR